MSVSRTRVLLRSFALVLMLGATTSVTAEDCGFAYQFCMPIYYSCLADGGYPPDCHAMLDQCILNNGCGTLP